MGRAVLNRNISPKALCVGSSVITISKEDIGRQRH